MTHWSADYVGQRYVPIENDCAALAVRVQREVFGRAIALPSERGAGSLGLSRQIDHLRDDYAIPTERPAEGDAVLMKCNGRLSHVGVYCRIHGVEYVLHAMKNAGQVVLHRIRELDRVNLIVQGYYRWR